VDYVRSAELKAAVRRDCDVSRADMIWLEVGRKEALSRAAAFDEIRRFHRRSRVQESSRPSRRNWRRPAVCQRHLLLGM